MNLSEKREKIRKWGLVGLIGLTGFVVAPIIFLTIKGLIGLIIAGTIGSLVVAFAPWWAMKLANWRVKAITSEAKENPIETMVNLLANKREAFTRFKKSVEDAVTAYKTFEKKCADFELKFGVERGSEFRRQLSAMGTLVEQKVQALREAQKSIAQAEDKLTEMRAYWEMSQAAQEANKAAGMDTGDLYERLKADTAVDSVFESVNRAFSQLEVAAALQEPHKMELVDNSGKRVIIDIDVPETVSR